jgi:hypothetical protein
MGSRLKGKKVRPKSKLERRTLGKILFYAALILGSLVLLWTLWLSDRGWEVARDMKSDKPAGASSGLP